MKIRKFLLFLTLSMVGSVLCAACGDDDEVNDNFVISSLKVTTENMIFPKEGGEQTFYVQSVAAPTATSDQGWCGITLGTTTNHLKVTPVVVKAEAMTTELTDRTAHITVNAGGQSVVVNVLQTAGDRVVVDKTSVDVAAEGGSFDIKVTSNGNYTVSTDASWLTETAKSNGNHTFTAAVNLVTSERKATITFTLNNEKAVVTVTQAAAQASSITATARDIAKQMYPGWNLGNTMEGGNNADNYKNSGISTETSWQSTKTSQAVIDCVKAQGFKSVRIPTAWVMGHITDEANMTIDQAWMNRVKEVVDYCINDGLYVVLNDHWDGGWLESSFENISDASVAANAEKLGKLWTQIATTFRDYDEHLLFAGLNEPNCDSQSKTNALLKYEQAFIDAVRATGGNNSKRTLVVQGPQTNINNTESWFDVTKLIDPAGEGHLMVEVHYYDPPQFTGVWEGNKPIWFWGTGNHVDGDSHNASSMEESYVLSQFQKMKTKFADKGYPVILGEYGANWRKISANQDKHDASIKLYHKTVCQRAVECGLVPMVWDVNVANQNGETGIMTVINRTAASVFCSFAMEGITEGVAAAKWPY